MKIKVIKYFLYLLIIVTIDVIFIGFLVMGSSSGNYQNSYNSIINKPLLLINIFKNHTMTKMFIDYQGLYILLLVIVLGYLYKPSKNGFDNTTHGSARWAKYSEIYKVLNQSKGIILSNKLFLGINSSINKNIVVIGSSGSGKSRGYIKPNVLQMNGNYVITDPKGEIFDDTSEYLKQNGYKIKVLNLVNLNSSDLYNPISYINDFQDIQILSRTIIDNTSVNSSKIENESFWNNAELSLLVSLICYVAYELPHEQKNLTSVLKLLLEGSENEKLNEIFLKLSSEHKALETYKIFCLCGDEKTRGNIMIGLAVRLQLFQNDAITKLTFIDTVELNKLGEEKTAIYIITSDSHRTYDLIASIFFSQLFQVLYNKADNNKGKLNIPVFCMFDEFSNIGKLPDFQSKVASMRSRGINVSIVLQSLGQLKSMYNNHWSDILGNCDTLLFLGSQDIETAKYISERLGKSTISNKSKSYSISNVRSDGGSKTNTEGNTSRILLTPDEIMRLDYKNSIIFIQGLYPILAEKYKIETHKAYQKLFKSDHNNYYVKNKIEYITFNPFANIVSNEKQTKPIKIKAIKKNEQLSNQIEITKEEIKFESTSIFENSDFGRYRDEL